MRRTHFARTLPTLAVALLALTAGCSDDDEGGTNPPPGTDLSGTYTLVSVQQGGEDAPECGPSLGCTGTLTLTATRYTLELTTPDPDDPLGSPPITIVDTGTYTTSGNEWTQTSDGNLPQSVGTYTLQGNTLRVDATSAGIRVISRWNKTS